MLELFVSRQQRLESFSASVIYSQRKMKLSGVFEKLSNADGSTKGRRTRVTKIVSTHSRQKRKQLPLIEQNSCRAYHRLLQISVLNHLLPVSVAVEIFDSVGSN